MRIQIGQWELLITLGNEVSKRNKKAEEIRRAYEARFIEKIHAVKQVRELFRDTGDARDSLKGSLEFIIRGPINV